MTEAWFPLTNSIGGISLKPFKYWKSPDAKGKISIVTLKAVLATNYNNLNKPLALNHKLIENFTCKWVTESRSLVQTEVFYNYMI